MADQSPNCNIHSSYSVESITDANTTHQRARAVYVGVSQSLDFCFDGQNWVLFKGASAGSQLDIMPVGVRKTAGSAAPDAGDVVFYY